jgi:hypothetical protein
VLHHREQIFRALVERAENYFPVNDFAAAKRWSAWRGHFKNKR